MGPFFYRWIRNRLDIGLVPGVVDAHVDIAGYRLEGSEGLIDGGGVGYIGDECVDLDTRTRCLDCLLSGKKHVRPASDDANVGCAGRGV